jgi:hypothetical protein
MPLLYYFVLKEKLTQWFGELGLDQANYLML